MPRPLLAHTGRPLERLGQACRDDRRLSGAWVFRALRSPDVTKIFRVHMYRLASAMFSGRVTRRFQSRAAAGVGRDEREAVRSAVTPIVTPNRLGLWFALP